MSDLLTAPQAAARLGVLPQTLYAYVSRGWVTRTRTAHGSYFDPLEIEAFAAQRVRRATRDAAAAPVGAGKPLMVLDTDIALIEDDELYLRGIPAARLARDHPFDAVAAWLWGEPLDDGRRLAVAPEFAGTAARLVAALPAEASWVDRIVVAVRGLAMADPLRDDVSPEALARAGEVVVAGIPRALSPEAPTGTVPEVLWHALTGDDAEPAQAAALNTAMVLCVDHDLAVSTLAGRVAASARGSGYAVVTAALGAFDSPLHGNASHAAAELIEEVMAGADAGIAIRARLKTLGRRAPGFGQAMYRGIDARAACLLESVAALPGADAAMTAVEALCEAMRPTGLQPNIDLALAVLTVVAGMPRDAGAAIFAVARSAGWIAHALDEHRRPPLRLRPQGRYVGPR